MSPIITLIRWVLIDFSPTCQFGLVLEYFNLFQINQMLDLKAIVVTEKILLRLRVSIEHEKGAEYV